MRETRLDRNGTQRLLRTDDYGTNLLDADGAVLAEHGNDRHEMMLETLAAEGWQVTADHHLPPPNATGRPPGNVTGDHAPRSPTATVTRGESG